MTEVELTKADRSASRGVDVESLRLQDRARLLSEVIGAFAEATVDYDQLLDIIARKLAEVVGDLCSVLLLSEDGNTLTLAATYDLDPQILTLARTMFSGDPLAVVPVQQRVLETGEAYLLTHVSPDRTRSTTTESRADFSARIGMHSVLLVALRARGQAIGVFNLLRHRPERPPYDDQDRDLAQLLADHAAVAIANARLLRSQNAELVLAKDAAENANRELEAFSYSVAHDLRAPLRAIDGFTSILQADYEVQLDEPGRRYLARVRAASQRMARLIDDLLTLSRATRATLHRKRVDLSELARRILHDLAARAPERRIEARVQDGLVAIADPGLLHVVLANLLENAWKFTSQRALTTIEVGDKGTAREAVFFVRDNGAGFDMAEADKLFTPFLRLHSDAQFEGSGIGLATVERVVRRHGGRIWAESQPEQGTTLFFTLGERVSGP